MVSTMNRLEVKEATEEPKRGGKRTWCPSESLRAANHVLVESARSDTVVNQPLLESLHQKEVHASKCQDRETATER
jgi:hypothetical protein